MKKRMKPALGLAAVLSMATASPLAAATTRCVNPSGTGGCFNTIQGAVDASSLGDLVKIAPGTYYENVVVPPGKDGLRIFGASRVTTILDPDTYTDLGIFNTGPGIQILSRNVQVRNLMIRNGRSDGIQAYESGAILQGLRLTGMAQSGIAVFGLFAQVVGNDISHAGIGIVSFEAQAIVKSNTVASCSIGIALLGDGAQAIGNRVFNNVRGLYVSLADGALLRSNDVRYTSGSGASAIETLQSRAPTLRSNRVLGADTGILVQCTDCIQGSLVGNSVTDTVQGVMVVTDSPGFLLQANSLLRSGSGFDLTGQGIVADRNRAREVGFAAASPCFGAFTLDGILTRNTAMQCGGEGFYVASGRTTLDRNLASGTLGNGFKIDAVADSILTRNRAVSNATQGFAVLTGATNTVLMSNIGSQNRTDFCDQGTTTVDLGNSFGTTSGTCDILP
jgi:nitrous oxidase accessory protein NosD